MNEETFLCIIKHKVPEVQQKIFSILSQNLEIIDQVERELSENEKVKLYGVEIPPKKRNQEPVCIILLLKGDKQTVQEIIGTEGAPHLSPLHSIRYMYGENQKDNAVDLWIKRHKGSIINDIFPKKQIHVAWLK